MSPGVRRVALITHVAGSVGWFGAVLAFLTLAVAGLAGSDAQTVRGAYLAMDVIGWYLLVPLALISLLSGLLQGLGTSWGLLRHYWVLFKLLITVVATVLLLVHMQVAGHVADAAAAGPLAASDLRGMRIQLAADAVAATAALLTTVTLSVWKPRGLTRRGHRTQRARSLERRPTVTA